MDVDGWVVVLDFNCIKNLDSKIIIRLYFFFFNCLLIIVFWINFGFDYVCSKYIVLNKRCKDY